MEIATLGAGCFWCIEAILLNVTGITSIDVGYTGGQTLNPTYKMVCEGNTGHAEVAQICLLYTSPSPRDVEESRMPSSA